MIFFNLLPSYVGIFRTRAHDIISLTYDIFSKKNLLAVEGIYNLNTEVIYQTFICSNLDVCLRHKNLYQLRQRQKEGRGVKVKTNARRTNILFQIPI